MSFFKLWNKVPLCVRNEPPRGKTNNVVSDQVQHKPACTVTEDGKKLKSFELSRGGIVHVQSE